MIEIDAVYEGKLHCRLTHGPSGGQIVTDAPKDNHGEGAAFSPTDLVAAALGSCVLTVMGIVAQRHNVELTGTSARVEKEMVNVPVRRVGRLAVMITFVRNFEESQRVLFERAALSCPVHHILNPEVTVTIRFTYPGD